MRVIAKKTLKEFLIKYPNSENALREWYIISSNSNWQNFHEIKSVFPSADAVGNHRVVFNICHNKYRLIVVFRYKIQMAFIRFINTHNEYDKIINIKYI